MIEFFKEYGWSFLLTINAIGSAFWGFWVTQNILRNRTEMRILKVDYNSWLDSKDERKLH